MAMPVYSAESQFLSAIRLPGESFQQAVVRSGLQLPGASLDTKEAPVLDVAESYLDFDSSDVPMWLEGDPLAAKKLSDAFKIIRDERTFNDPEHKDFPRRIPWLFPDDGCYVRAAIFDQEIERLGYPRGWKIFAFGTFWINTSNHPDGQVMWWFHVAPVFRLADGLYVTDPSLFPDGPIKMKDWLKFLAPDHDMMKIQMVTCDPLSFSPHSRCIGGGNGMDKGAIRQMPDFLYFEWNRQVKLGRDPLLVLGDQPPWKTTP